MKINILIYCVVVLVPWSCGKPISEKVSSVDMTLDSPSTIDVIGRESYLDRATPSSWTSHEIMLKTEGTLEAIYFSDERRGWVGGTKATLYRTDNGGTNWETIKLDAPNEMTVRHILFLNELVGWVALQKPRDRAIEGDQPNFRLMHTRDGGRNWQLQYHDSNVVLTQLAFSDERNGWLTGIAYQKPGLNTYFILHTNDQGLHWNDASHALKRIASEDHHNLNDGIMGITFAGSAATVITSDLRLFRLSNEGHRWLGFGSFQDTSPFTSVIRQLGDKNGKYLWAIGGSSSSHSGTRAWLYTQQNDHSWRKYVLGNVFFEDAVCLSPDQFLAAGFTVRNVKTRGTYQMKTEAVVLSSVDDGQNWEIAYHNPQIRGVNCINSVNESLVWAAGANGLLVKLKKLR